MLLKGRPIGIWVLFVWSAAHTIPGGLLASDISGGKGFLAWLLVALEAGVAAGLLLRWGFVRYLLIIQVALNVFVFSLLAWAFAFVAIAWGLHPSDLPIVVVIFAYLLFVAWAFMYLFHPSIQEHLRWLPHEAVSARHTL